MLKIQTLSGLIWNILEKTIDKMIHSFEFFIKRRKKNSLIISRIILLFFLFILIECASSKKTSTSKMENGLEQIDLFANGDDGIANYRIPALITTTKGTLLAVCDARVDRRGDLPNNIDLALRRSTDNGKTWSKTKILFDYPGKEGGGDPAMLVDKQTGKIWLFFVYGAEGVGINQSKQGYGKDSTQQLMTTYSIDDGLTWSEPHNITREVKDVNWYGVFFASGRGIQTRSGRLMVNLMVRKEFGTANKDHAYIAYSDDHGTTWKASESAGIKMGESKVVELEDGSIMINMRSKHHLKRRAINISKDNGTTWGKYSHESGLIEPTCNASIIRYTSVKDGFKKSRILFSNPANENKRRNMAVRISYDEGKTWSPPKVVHSGPAAYSSLTVLHDGSIGLFYERGNIRADEKITFAKFTLEWLTDGTDKLSENRPPNKR